MFDPARLVFIDETAANTKMVRLRGRGPRGERLIGRVPQGHWKTITFVAALRRNGMRAPYRDFTCWSGLTGKARKGITKAFRSVHRRTVGMRIRDTRYRHARHTIYSSGDPLQPHWVCACGRYPERLRDGNLVARMLSIGDGCDPVAYSVVSRRWLIRRGAHESPNNRAFFF